ncbi:hypothetical protein SAMN04489740_1382 [Arthrobacter alpinus]|uniref:Uncharacterized protein n=1 Tax=Arthrobacter alpinus TaxID=656366 RepID=A0A1H5IQY4_9MICC|nr:hypothetical protein SAMN04489740_1382 [Arthrobacter alpinus]
MKKSTTTRLALTAEGTLLLAGRAGAAIAEGEIPQGAA